MEIAMLCQETSLFDFVGDLSDFTIMINSMSPAIREFMEDSFYETRYTRKINSIEWENGKNLRVFQNKHMIIN